MNPHFAYLMKLKSQGWEDARIARKLGIPEEQVRSDVLQAMHEAAHAVESGYSALCECFSTLYLQYQLVGESLKVLAGVLSQRMSAGELEKLWDPDPKKTVENLLKGCIPLRSFVPPSSPPEPFSGASN